MDIYTQTTLLNMLTNFKELPRSFYWEQERAVLDYSTKDITPDQAIRLIIYYPVVKTLATQVLDYNC